MGNNPFEDQLTGWNKDSRGDWWMPQPALKVPPEMKFPFYTDNVTKTMTQMGQPPMPGQKWEGYSWVNPGSELSPPWGTMLLPHNPPQWLQDHESKHLDGFIHPGMGQLWDFLNMLKQRGIAFKE